MSEKIGTVVFLPFYVRGRTPDGGFILDRVTLQGEETGVRLEGLSLNDGNHIPRNPTEEGTQGRNVG